MDGHDADALRAFRRYVTGFVNRHDFNALPTIMHANYTLSTAGLEIGGRDGPYRKAVKQQLDQFPGLQFTIHDLFVSGNAVAVHFTEHGASIRDGGALAAWPSIAIYEAADGLLSRCAIEQDYLRRRRQLAGELPVRIDPPAIAPWDQPDRAPAPEAERDVQNWLQDGAWLTNASTIIDDSDLTGGMEPVIDDTSISIERIVSADLGYGTAKVAFHAAQSGHVVEQFAQLAGAPPGVTAHIHLAGLVTIARGRVQHGHIIRDRLGLQRRLTASRPNDRPIR